jgi:succinylarginine dihydrolase
MTGVEAQLDRLVGPTHHFGGLGVGNVASLTHSGEVSNPRAAALQGLDKMALVGQLGVPQFVLPPQDRPRLGFLRALGFSGSERDVLRRAVEEAPQALSAAMSCSAMWTANAATVSAAEDSPRGRLTATIANLESSLHRTVEPAETAVDLAACLPPDAEIQPPLPGGYAMRDEGAANHMRLGTGLPGSAIHLFVDGDGQPHPRRFIPRQTRAASRAVARLHSLASENTFFLKQHPDAIDSGAFHNDVVAMSHADLLIHHAGAFWQSEETLRSIRRRFESLHERGLKYAVVTDEELSLQAAVDTYLFNSQIVSAGDAGTPPVIVCPQQVREHDAARRLVESWRDRLGWFSEVRYVDLRESMAGGGGPACLRLRVPVDRDELRRFNEAMRWTPELDGRLRQCVTDRYPSAVTLSQLAEPEWVEEQRETARRIRSLLGAT